MGCPPLTYILLGLDIWVREAKVMLVINIYGYPQFDFSIDYCYDYWFWL
jgi:hypothetical protein